METETMTEATRAERIAKRVASMTDDELRRAVAQLHAEAAPLEREVARRVQAARTAATIVALRGRPPLEQARWIRPPGRSGFHLFRATPLGSGRQRLTSLCGAHEDPPAPTAERRAKGEPVSEIAHGAEIRPEVRCRGCTRAARTVPLRDLAGQLRELVTMTDDDEGDAGGASAGTLSTSPVDTVDEAAESTSAAPEPVESAPANRRPEAAGADTAQEVQR